MTIFPPLPNPQEAQPCTYNRPAHLPPLITVHQPPFIANRRQSKIRHHKILIGQRAHAFPFPTLFPCSQDIKPACPPPDAILLAPNLVLAPPTTQALKPTRWCAADHGGPFVDWGRQGPVCGAESRGGSDSSAKGHPDRRLLKSRNVGAGVVRRQVRCLCIFGSRSGRFLRKGARVSPRSGESVGRQGKEDAPLYPAGCTVYLVG